MANPGIDIKPHFQTKEEIDELFSEIKAQGLVIDSKLDYTIRMAIQKVKLHFIMMKSLLSTEASQKQQKVLNQQY
jgi:hypothetical protein